MSIDINKPLGQNPPRNVVFQTLTGLFDLYNSISNGEKTMSLTKTNVVQIYLSLFGKELTEEQVASQKALLALIDNEQDTTAAVGALFSEFAETDSQDLIAQVYQNLFNYPSDDNPQSDANDEGIAFWAGALDRGVSLEDVLENIAEISSNSDNPANAANRTSIVAAVEAAKDNLGIEDEENDDEEGEGTGQKGEDFYLTVGQDVGDDNKGLKGTDGDDTFYADLGQNALGQQANTLGSGDVLNGGAGTDTLDATLIAGHSLGNRVMDVMPTTKSVEIVKINAQLTSDAAFKNKNGATLNARKMDGVQEFTSKYSDADLTIKNISTNGVTGGTKAMTIGMEYTGNANSNWDESNMTALFDQDYLTRSAVDSNSLYYFTQDRLAANADNKPFDAKTTAVNGIRFMLDNQVVEIVVDEDILNTYFKSIKSGDRTNAYEGFKDLLKDALAAKNAEMDGALDGFEISVDAGFVRTKGAHQNQGDQLKFSVPAIVLTAPENVEITSPSISQKDKFLSTYDMFNDTDDEQVTSNTPVEINVDLEKVGLAGDGGGLQIGSMNKGDNENKYAAVNTVTSTVDGFDQFNVKVGGSKQESSSLAYLHSTNNALRKVDIKSQTGSDANLTIGNSNTNVSRLIEDSDEAANAFKDVQIVDASEFNGNLTLNAGITKEIVEKYLNYEGEQPFATHNSNEVANFDYKGGNGDDVINIFIDEAALDDAFESTTGGTNRNVFEMNINGGAGDDVITVTFDNNEGALASSLVNGITNITINGGAGNDVIDIKQDLGSGSSTDATFTIAFDGQFGHDTIIGFDTGIVTTSNEVQEIDLAGFKAHKGEIIKVTIGNATELFPADAYMNDADIATQVKSMLEASATPANDISTQQFDANGALIGGETGTKITATKTGANVETVKVEVINSQEAGGTYDKHYDTKHSVEATTTTEGGLKGSGSDLLDFSAYNAKAVVVDNGSSDIISTGGTFANGSKFIYLEKAKHNDNVYNVYEATAKIAGIADVGFGTGTASAKANNATKGAILGSIDFVDIVGGPVIDATQLLF